jgi:hypothetical protein
MDVKRQYRAHADEQEMIEEARNYIVETLDKATNNAKYIKMEQLHYKVRTKKYHDELEVSKLALSATKRHSCNSFYHH